jgi:hypothetical protein
MMKTVVKTGLGCRVQGEGVHLMMKRAMKTTAIRKVALVCASDTAMASALISERFFSASCRVLMV